MKTRILFIAVALAPLVAGSAAADEAEWLTEGNFSANVALTTDYVWRGISQTDESWAIQGGFDYASPVGMYLGTWASNVAFGGSIEMDFYGGFASELAGVRYDLGYNYYAYPKAHDDTEFNFGEFYASLGYTFDVSLSPEVGASYNYSPQFFGEDGAGHYVAGTLGLSLPFGLELSGELGRQNVEGDKYTGKGGGLDNGDGFEYTHWRVGGAYDIKNFTLDLSYHDTNEHDFLGKIAEKRVVFSVSRSL